MIELMEETANMLRGMCMDPRIPQDTKEALWSRVRKLDAATEAALRAALAQQAEPVQEPVAWSGYDLDGMVEAFSRVIEARYQRANPFQNPIDMDAQMALRILRGFIPAMKAYAAPPQRKPLTDEEIPALAEKAWTPSVYCDAEALLGTDGLVALVRAVEAKHNIKESP